MTELLKIETIKEVLQRKSELLIEFEFDAFTPKYFNELVRELSGFTVSEVRPLQKIWISKGIETKILKQHIRGLKKHILTYNELRKNVFNKFLSSLDLDKIEGEFYKLRQKLQEQNKWPKGNFNKWIYWSHGGDIEFDNIDTKLHFNIRMSNINSIKYWSIHRYISKTENQSNTTKFIIENKKEIPKMLDLMVLNNELKVIRTPFGEKQYELR